MITLSSYHDNMLKKFTHCTSTSGESRIRHHITQLNINTVNVLRSKKKYKYHNINFNIFFKKCVIKSSVA
jgi:hypothetical protein